MEPKLHDQKQPGDGELFPDRWVLIKGRDQSEFQTPTTSLKEGFNNDFRGATIEELGTFALEHFGPEGDMGHGIASDFFGVLDARSAEDLTLICVSYTRLSREEEAGIHVEWGVATRHDKALMAYSARPTDEDIALLLRGIDASSHDTPSAAILSHGLPLLNRGQPPTSVPDMPVRASVEDLERLKRWYEGTAKANHDVWIGLRVGADFSCWHIGGIYYRGAEDFLVAPGDEFDKSGVLKATPW